MTQISHIHFTDRRSFENALVDLIATLNRALCELYQKFCFNCHWSTFHWLSQPTTRSILVFPWPGTITSSRLLFAYIFRHWHGRQLIIISFYFWEPTWSILECFSPTVTFIDPRRVLNGVVRRHRNNSGSRSTAKDIKYKSVVVPWLIN